MTALAVSGIVDGNESDVPVWVERRVSTSARGGGTGCEAECLLMKRLPIDCGGSRKLNFVVVGLSVERNGDRRVAKHRLLR